MKLEVTKFIPTFVTEIPSWLNSFASDFNNWSGVSLRLNGEINRNLRAKIVDKNPTLIDVRNYMFSRQSLMLLKLGKPWEVRSGKILDLAYDL